MFWDILCIQYYCPRFIQCDCSYINDFSQGSGQDGGTLPRAIDVIFNSIEDLQTKKYQLKPDKLNGFEIQNEADAAIDR